MFCFILMMCLLDLLRLITGVESRSLLTIILLFLIQLFLLFFSLKRQKLNFIVKFFNLLAKVIRHNIFILFYYFFIFYVLLKNSLIFFLPFSTFLSFSSFSTIFCPVTRNFVCIHLSSSCSSYLFFLLVWRTSFFSL